jgi:hypothetical protein
MNAVGVWVGRRRECEHWQYLLAKAGVVGVHEGAAVEGYGMNEMT